jgi:hypothetical protein
VPPLWLAVLADGHLVRGPHCTVRKMDPILRSIQRMLQMQLLSSRSGSYADIA